MTLNILKRLPAVGKPKSQNGTVGEPDAHVFNCPKCARPLSDGTPRCPGCGTRLIMGVVFRRASVLIGFGFIVGAFLGGVIMSVVVTTLIAVPRTGVVTVPTTPGGPAASQAASSAKPSPVEVVIPAVALSSLRQMSLLDARIVDDASSLAAAVKAKKSAVDLALVVRSVASDATIGSDLVAQVGSWDDASQFASDRQAFYDELLAIAHDGLGNSLSDKKAYQATAKKMLKVLRRLPALDAASRQLATTAKVNLPKVDLTAVGGSSN